MIPVAKLLLAVFSSATAFALWKLIQFVHREAMSPLRNLRGPRGSSWIYGSMQDVWKSENSTLLEQWVKEYGNTITFKGFFFSNRLFTMDTRAISHVLTHNNNYPKPSQVRYNLSQKVGPGVLVVEGSQHRQQRHIMNPAFGPAQIRELTHIFTEKAVKLRDVWLSEIAKESAEPSSGVRVDTVQWLNRMTLDVIGLAGFNYNFNALDVNEKPNELSEAFATVAASDQTPSILALLRVYIPFLRFLPDERSDKVKVAQRTMARIGNELLSDAKVAARASMTEKGDIGKSSLQGRDLLSLLVKANMATDLQESQKMSDEDVLAQVPTFLVAGHETTSTATTWALYAMSLAPEVQTKLREELLSLDTDDPSMDQLMALPYLDAVVRETLRVHSPVPGTQRIAMKDDVLPVDKPYMDKYGVSRDSIKINKGDRIFIPILAMNRSKELWGPDAHEFKPERWENVPEGISRVPGVWGHLLSFLGGPRACIGYRFSLVEMKALLFTLVRAFEFELAVPSSEIKKKTEIVQLPILRSDPKKRAQLPLLIKPYKQAI